MARRRDKGMSVREMTLEQIRVTGLTALAHELGPVEMARFLQQFETGRGDYSVDRHRRLGERNVEQLAKAIRRRRKQS